MLELTQANVVDYLRTHWPLPLPLRVTELSGGVSNLVLCIQSGARKVVLKQSRPQLRTRDAWFSDVARIYREQEVMQMLEPLLPPCTVPRVLFIDRTNFVFIMEHAPEGARVWKQMLLSGTIDLAVAQLVGRYLGRIHEATTVNPQLTAPFCDQQVFVQLRAEPFYQRVRERRPEVAVPVGAIMADMLSRTEALCHGDYTPKNMLVHADGFTLVDYETACCGDPAMDIGLFLCHLLLKAVHLSARRHQFFELIEGFWAEYAAQIHHGPVQELQQRGLQHLAVCLLARIDGTSPVDYLCDESKRELVRHISRQILFEKIGTWQELLACCDHKLSNLDEG